MKSQPALKDTVGPNPGFEPKVEGCIQRDLKDQFGKLRALTDDLDLIVSGKLKMKAMNYYGMTHKKLPIMFSMLFLFSGVHSACGQGTIVFNNLGPNNGRVFTYNLPSGGPEIPPTLLNQDLNFSLRVDRPGMILEVLRTWLLSDGTANGINVGPGLFADPSQSVIEVPGILPGEYMIFSIGAWAENYPTLDAAKSAGTSLWGESAPFGMVAGTMEAPPASLVGMPDFSVAVPEPRILSMAVVGVGLFLLHRMKRPSTGKAHCVSKFVYRDDQDSILQR